VGQSSTGSVNILQTSTFTSLRNISTGCGSVAEVDFSWDNARLLICGSSALEIYSTSTWARETQITGSTFTACKFQKNNKYAAGDSSGKTNVYLTVANTLEWSDSQGGSITSLDFDMVNYTLISTNGAGNKYNLYPSAKWPAGGTTQTLIKGVSVTNSANSVAFAKEGSIYAIGTSNNLLIYENSTNNNLFNWTTGSVVSGVFSYDSQYFIAGGSSGIAKVFKRMCQSCPSGTY
jgi:WD40 repeat protein